MANKLIYAGIGSRKTPKHILQQMQSIGEQLGLSGWHLRSGYADGADMAFGRGAEAAGSSFDMFLPWQGFNHAPIGDARFTVPSWTSDLLDIAERAYNQKDPRSHWGSVKASVKCLMARNVCQVLGANVLEGEHSHLVICYTPAGRGEGGTGQAIRVARMYGIPVFDLGDPDPQVRMDLISYVAKLELQFAEEQAVEI